MPLTPPPLNALRAFEAAARHGGFVAAAAELGVSAAAVSQQVRKLEDHFGRILFRRMNNRVALTDAGLAIFAEVAEAMQRLAAVGERLQPGLVARRAVLSVPGFLAGWVADRLKGVAEAMPDLTLDLRIEEDPVAFARDGIDLRLALGENPYPDLHAEMLFRDEMAPVASPAFLARREGLVPAGITASDLVHTDWGKGIASLPGWTEWFGAAGLPPPPALGRGHRAGDAARALDLARAGFGLVLGWGRLAAADLAAARLVQPFGPSLALPHPVTLVMPHLKRRRADLLGLSALLREGA